MEYNLRVYGLLIEEGRVLITDELRSGTPMTKFPGGGVEAGEGLEEALIREWEEETYTKIRVGKLLYVNPFYHKSGFFVSLPLLSVYYQVHLEEPLACELNTEKYFLPKETPGDWQQFRWLNLNDLATEEFTFVVDKALVENIVNQYIIIQS
jgi:8-oxo-dGTP diphosphatase